MSSLYPFSLFLVICCIQIWALAPACEASNGVGINTVRLNRNRKLAATTPPFKVKAVNLGGWLVTEGWIKPSLFDGIPNKDLLVCLCAFPLQSVKALKLCLVGCNVTQCN